MSNSSNASIAIQPSNSTDSLIYSQAQLRAALGGISAPTLWRLLHNEKQQFPQPVHILARKFWRVSDVQSWIEQRVGCGGE